MPYASPISEMGILFYNTLFDENASCHLALGECYPTTVQDGEKMNEEELHQIGGNHSINHVDFMIGTKRYEDYRNYRGWKRNSSLYRRQLGTINAEFVAII